MTVWDHLANRTASYSAQVTAGLSPCV